MAGNGRTCRVLLNYAKFGRFFLQRQNCRVQASFLLPIVSYCSRKTNIELPIARSLITSANTGAEETPIDSVTYERVCSETLDALCDYFEELTENAKNLAGSDVTYGDGVLTVKLGQKYGTYVINRQTPNKQIWLSSPTSGPKRYDFIGPKSAESGRWIYKHNGESMHELLQREMQQIFKGQSFDFRQLPYSC